MELKKVGIGLYEDENKVLHVDAKEILEHYGIQPTKEVLDDFAQMSEQLCKAKGIEHEDAGYKPWP